MNVNIGTFEAEIGGVFGGEQEMKQEKAIKGTCSGLFLFMNGPGYYLVMYSAISAITVSFGISME